MMSWLDKMVSSFVFEFDHLVQCVWLQHTHIDSYFFQSPFTKSRGWVQCVSFDPIRPMLFVAVRTALSVCLSSLGWVGGCRCVWVGGWVQVCVGGWVWLCYTCVLQFAHSHLFLFLFGCLEKEKHSVWSDLVNTYIIMSWNKCELPLAPTLACCYQTL